ncbi:MAG: M20/M25/M40 family metallo-hydrolase [archaeon]
MNKKRLEQTLIDLIRIQSTSGNEGAIADYVVHEFSKIGYRASIDKEGNVYAEAGRGKKSLMFNAHLDTVPPHPGMKRPYEPAKRGRRVYGLGATDCKAGIACIIELARSIPPEGKLKFLFTVREESSASGRPRGSISASKKHMADFCIVAEPTYKEKVPQVAAGARGRTLLKIDVKGKSSHSSRPEDGVNAIEEAMKLFKKLEKVYLNKRRYHDVILHETLSVVNMEVKSTANNVIPDNCRITVDYRTLPGRKDALKVIKRLISEAGVKAKPHVVFSSPGYVLMNEIKPLGQLRSALHDEFGGAPVTSIALGKADAEYFHRAGTKTVICGPGISRLCHSADEYARVDLMAKWTTAVESFVKNYFNG